MKKVKSKQEEKIIKVGNIERKVQYRVLDDLPSGKRYYSDIGKVYVRGLFYGEVVEASKIDGDNLDEVIGVYSEAIKFENEKYTLYDLEPIDFILFTSMVNIMTTPDFSWKPDFECTNVIPNPKIKNIEREIEHLEIKKQANLEQLETGLNQNEDDYKEEDWKSLQNEIEYLEEQVKNLDKEILEYKKMYYEIIEEEPYVICGSKVMTEISLDDFNFETADENVTFPYFYDFGNLQLELKPILVKDLIKVEDNEYNEILYISQFIDNPDAYDLLKMSMPWEIEELKKEIERFEIILKPFKTKCLKCGKEYEIQIDIKDIKVLP